MPAFFTGLDSGQKHAGRPALNLANITKYICRRSVCHDEERAGHEQADDDCDTGNSAVAGSRERNRHHNVPGSILGCCSGWADHMREFGFDVKVIKTDGMVSVKRAFGVPAELGSCHTAVVDSTGQIVEGHVPASAVEKMLENASVKGVAVRGMAVDSPGIGELGAQDRKSTRLNSS